MYGELPELETTDGRTVNGFPVQIPNSPTGPKTCVLRLPTSDELLTYLRAQRSLYRDLGRGKGEGEDVPTPEADTRLFDSIRLDKTGPDFDEAEANYAIRVITSHKVRSCERDGQHYVVTLATLFGDCVHEVRIPFQKELAEYRRDIYRPRDLPNGVEERRFVPDVAVRLYDSVVVSVKGYTEAQLPLMNGKGPLTAVPPHHKRSVIYSLNAALGELDPSLDPN